MLPNNMESYEPLSVSQRSQLRRIMLCISEEIAGRVSKRRPEPAEKLRSDMLSAIEYAPVWIIMAVALSTSVLAP